MPYGLTCCQLTDLALSRNEAVISISSVAPILCSFPATRRSTFDRRGEIIAIAASAIGDKKSLPGSR